MTKSVLIFVFVIAINCVFAQMQQMNNQIPIKIGIASENLSFPPKLSFINNYKPLTIENKQLKSGISTKWEMDTIITYDTISNDTLGQLYERCTQTFDVSGHVLISKFDFWQNNTWVGVYKEIYTYNANGNTLTNLEEYCQNNVWGNYVKLIYTYDTNGNMLTYIFEEWQNKWVNYFRYTYTYDAKGNELTNLYEVCQNNVWKNISRDTLTYDANGKMVTDLVTQQWQNNAWVNNSKDTLTYDLNGKMLTELYEEWQNNTWVIKSMNSYKYDTNGNILTDLIQKWKNVYWANNSKDSLTYDADGNMLTYLTEAWKNNACVNSERCTYIYDANGNSITEKYEVWNDSTWVPSRTGISVYSQKKRVNGVIGFPIYRYVAHWISFTAGINELTNNNEQLTIYPNPANDIITIDFTGYSEKNKSIVELYSITGGLIKTFPIQSKLTEVNISDLSEGVYIIKVTNENGVAVKRVVIQ